MRGIRAQVVKCRERGEECSRVASRIIPATGVYQASRQKLPHLLETGWPCYYSRPIDGQPKADRGVEYPSIPFRDPWRRRSPARYCTGCRWTKGAVSSFYSFYEASTQTSGTDRV